MENLKDLTIREIAALIRKDWKKVYFGAVPYLDALSEVDSLSDPYYAEDGRTQSLYFRSNASGWRGPVAKAIKAELKRREDEPGTRWSNGQPSPR